MSSGERFPAAFLEFGRRFQQTMSEEMKEGDFATRARFWETMAQLNHLQRALEEASEEPSQERIDKALARMRIVLDAFGGRKANPEPDRRAQSVEERNWYVQWSEWSGYRPESPAAGDGGDGGSR